MIKQRTIFPVTVRSVAIPTEHGGWMFLIEPILLGLGVAFSLPGLLLALAALGAFLLRHPLKIAVDDHRRGKRYERTAVAERFTVIYGFIALLALSLAIFTADSRFILPLLLALPLVAVQLYFDFGKRSRELAAELSGSVAMGAVASSIAIMSGWNVTDSLVLWILLAARFVPAILYVRQRLRLEYGKEYQVIPVAIAHITALAIAFLLVFMHLAPWTAVAAMLLLLTRAAYGLSHRHGPTRPQVVGIQETMFGLCTSALYIVGFNLML